jgi:putative membrane protein
LRLSLALAIPGVLLATLVVGYYGFGDVLRTVASVGWSGFAILLACQLGLFLVLGAAWLVITPGAKAALPWVFHWARMVRDSAGTCLPFSQVGGLVLGARALTMHGVPWPLASAATVVDVTTELLAQIAFSAIGLLILLARAPGSALTVPVSIALLVALAAAFGFVWAQHGALSHLSRFSDRLAGQWFAGTGARVDALQGELGRIYRRPGHLALGCGLHLVGWIGTGAAGWVAYRLLGADIDFLAALAIEALLSATLAVAFVVPGAAGVQEAGYAVFGSVFGLSPELSIGVSLLRRAKDLTLGVPILLVWQFLEVRRLRVVSS